VFSGAVVFRRAITKLRRVPSEASNEAERDRVLVTVTGHDRPGVTSTLTGILAEKGAALADIEQVVVQGQLTLCLLVDLPRSRDVLKELLFAAKQLGMDLDFKPVVTEPGAAGDVDRRGEHQWYVITAIAPSLGATHIHAIASILATEGANIEKISRLSEGALASVEIHATLPGGADTERLKRALLGVAMRASFDVALQREGLYRRSKRLVVLDMDSTLIRIEVIDELARAAGVHKEVAGITERAMQGELNYDESLRQRVGLLKGLDAAVLDKIAAELPLTDGAETLVRVLKRLGYRIAIISGGFSRAADSLKRRLGIDYAFSNNLEIEGGKLTGRVVGPVVNAARKAELLELIAQLEGVLLDQVIAVGDGANDILMLERAGLGIAFHAKSKLREAADTSISGAGLDAILYLLGISAREIKEIQ
jgi:phosphoserine phosphatase